MTEKDIYLICSSLDRTTEREVQSLSEAHIWWLPDIESVPKVEVTHYVRHALRGFEGVHRRLLAIAWLYCCLAERQVLESRYTYCFSHGPSAAVDRFSLPDKLARFLKERGDSTVCDKTQRENAVYACIMTAKVPPNSADRNVLCLCITRALPYVFAHVLDKKTSFSSFFKRAFEQRLMDLQVGGTALTSRVRS
ncbi:hypothetical protein MRX96_053561 [Rhipicephalus microplus]